jgi:hypothetical protein
MVPLQLTPEDELLLLVPDPGLPEGSIDTGDLESAFRARHARATVIRATPTKTVPEDRVRECRVAVVFLISRGPLDAWQAETACRAAALAPRSVLVAAFNPFVFPESVPRAARIATYDFSPPAMRALADRMF